MLNEWLTATATVSPPCLHRVSTVSPPCLHQCEIRFELANRSRHPKAIVSVITLAPFVTILTAT